MTVGLYHCGSLRGGGGRGIMKGCTKSTARKAYHKLSLESDPLSTSGFSEKAFLPQRSGFRLQGTGCRLPDSSFIFVRVYISFVARMHLSDRLLDSFAGPRQGLL